MASVKGSVSSPYTLSGTISIASPKEIETYTGDYEITPLASTGQILQTADKLMEKDISVAAIPYYEVSNDSEGKTVYIATSV